MGRVYAVASGKGGVGKTTTVANLGAVLAAGGHETVVVDADLGMGNLAGVLGIDADDGPTVHDVLAGTADISEAIREGPDGLGVVPASNDLDDFGAAEPSNLASLVTDLDASVVLLDTSAGLSHDSVEPLRIADEVLLVSTPERGAVGDTVKTREVTDRFETSVAGAVLTRVTPETDVDDVRDRLGVPIRGTVPEDSAVSAAAESGKPLTVAAPDAPATAAYRRIAADLTGDDSLESVEEETTAADEAEASEGESGSETTDAEEATDETSAPSDRTEGEPEAGESEDGADGETETDDDVGADAEEATQDASRDEATESEDPEADEAEVEASDDEAENDDEDDERTGFLRWLLR
ncbi:MAG: P-loop NTPase [Haloplanus sp.]